jgi:peptidyl-prolyl cis-trans isomerase D
MLGLFRRFSKSPIGLGIFALILIAFVVTLYQGKSGFDATSLTSGSGIASVGGDSIDEAEMTRRVQNQLEGERQRDPAIDMAKFVAAGGLDRTIDLTATGRALQAFAEQQGMVASKKLIDGAIASIPAFRGPTGKFDPTTFQQVISQRKVTEAMLRGDFAREALTKALAIPVAGAARVPEGLVQPYASLLLEAREGLVAAVPSEAFLPKTTPTDAELQAFYGANIARYTVPERRVIRYATFDKSRVADKAVATDAEIQALYTKNAANYAASEKRSFTQLIVSTQAQANDLLAKVKGGMSMADAAKSVQRDAIAVPTTDLKAFEKLTGPKVAAAAFAAPKGSFAAVEQSELGFHIVKVDTVTTVAATPLSAVRTKLATEIATQKESRAIADMVGAIEDSVSGGATFDEIAKKYGFTATATPPLTSDGRAVDVPGYTAPSEVTTVLSAAFQAQADDEASVTALPQNAGYIFWKLDRTIAAAPKPLAEVREMVVADVKIDQGLKAAKTAADAIAAAVNAGTPLAQALTKAGVPLPAPKPAKARRIDLAQAQGRVPPPLALMFAMPEKRARVLQVANRAGWFIVYLDKIDRGDARMAPGLIQATQQQLSGAIGDEYVQQFAAAVRADIGVRKNAAAIAKLKASLVGGGSQ